MDWLLEAELTEHYPRARQIAGVGVDAPDEATRQVAITEAIERAITSAEGQARSRLLRSRCFAPDALPPDAASASADLKRLVADLTWWHLHKRLEFQEDAVPAIKDAALQELADIAVARDRAALFAELPVEETAALTVGCIKRGQRAPKALKLSNLWD